jgi:HlyD family secretion protein
LAWQFCATPEFHFAPVMEQKNEGPPAAAKQTLGAAGLPNEAANQTVSTTETHSTTQTVASTRPPQPAQPPPGSPPAPPSRPAPGPQPAPNAQPSQANKPAQPKQPAPPNKAVPPAEPPPSGKKKALIAAVLVLVFLAALAIGFGLGRLGGSAKKDPNRLVLFGNVDLRQVELAFDNSERIAEVLVEEGDKVTRGQVLARLDTSRIKPQAAAAEAQMDAQKAVVQKLHRGSRPEEIAQAKANVALATADQVNAEQQWRRLTALAGMTTGRAVSQQDLDGATAALDTAKARLAVAESALELSTIGPREEDIAQGEALLRANQDQLELLRRQLADAELLSPCDAVVRSRLLEPGEMVSPQRPVFDLAITDPKWIRTYVSEPYLGRIHAGMKAAVSTDSFPGRSLTGWIGFVSSVAEFTPKAVQTEQLRPALVYEIRVFVHDPQDEMRLGMPATVRLELGPAAQGQP